MLSLGLFPGPPHETEMSSTTTVHEICESFWRCEPAAERLGGGGEEEWIGRINTAGQRWRPSSKIDQCGAGQRDGGIGGCVPERLQTEGEFREVVLVGQFRQSEE